MRIKNLQFDKRVSFFPTSEQYARMVDFPSPAPAINIRGCVVRYQKCTRPTHHKFPEQE
jgi:hypothetical protein